MAQKILARAAGKSEVKTGEYAVCAIDVAMTRELLADVVEAGVSKVWDVDKVVVVLDHEVPAPSVEIAEAYKKAREGVKLLGIKNFFPEGYGVCHQVMIDKGYVVPGSLIVATDSHTTMYGALGAAGTGIGTSEMAYVMATGKLWFKVPETIKSSSRANFKSASAPKTLSCSLPENTLPAPPIISPSSLWGQRLKSSVSPAELP